MDTISSPTHFSVDDTAKLHVEKSDRSFSTMAMGIRSEYLPLSDITAFELAQLLPFCMGRYMTEADWSSLGSATRHLKRLN